MPSTRNPFVSFTDSSELIKLLSYNEAVEIMLDVICNDEDIKNLQSSTCLALQNFRFEKAYMTFVERYLTGQ